MILKCTQRNTPRNSRRCSPDDPGGLKENEGISLTDRPAAPPRGQPTLVPRPARGREESEGTGCTPGAEPGKKNIKLRMKRTRVVGLDKMPIATSEEAMPQNNGRRQSTRERRTCDQQGLEHAPGSHTEYIRFSATCVFKNRGPTLYLILSLL